MTLKQKVKTMRVKAISLVGQGAEKNSNFFMLQSADGTKALIAQYVDRLRATPDAAGRLGVIDELAQQLRLTTGPNLAQGVTEEQNELLAKSGGWLTWQAFQEYLIEQVTSPEEAVAAVDEFCGLLKTMLTLPGDNDGDEAPWQTNSSTTGTTMAAVRDAMYQVAPKETDVNEETARQIGLAAAQAVLQATQGGEPAGTAPTGTTPVAAQTIPIAPQTAPVQPVTPPVAAGTVTQAAPVPAPTSSGDGFWGGLDLTSQPAAGTAPAPVLPESAHVTALAQAITASLLTPPAGTVPAPAAVPMTPPVAPVVAQVTPDPVASSGVATLQPFEQITVDQIKQAIAEAVQPIQAKVDALTTPVAQAGSSRQPDQEAADLLKQRIAEKGIWSVGPLAPLHN